MVTHQEFKQAEEVVRQYRQQRKESRRLYLEVVKNQKNGISKFSNVNREMDIYDTYISVRLLNILRFNHEKLGYPLSFKIKELENLSVSKFLKCRGAGERTLQELKELCFCAEVSLKP